MGKYTWNDIIAQIKKISEKGFFDIVGAGIVNKICTLLASVLSVRLLTKTEFGEISYILNIINLIAIGSSLGMDNVALQFGSEEKELDSKNKIFKFAFCVGTTTNFFISVIIVFIQKNNFLLLCASLLLVFMFWNNFSGNVYRVLLKNKVYARITNVYTLSFLIFTTLGATYNAVNGYLLGYYLSYIVTILVAIYCGKDNVKRIVHAAVLQTEKRKECIKYGTLIIASNAASQILYYLDVLMIGIVAGQATNVASYKTATIIPTALNAIPVLVVKFIYPYFAENRKNKVWILKNWKRIVIISFPCFLAVGIVGILFSKVIITIFFGKEYLESQICFQILMLSFVISGTFRIISGNILTMLRKVKSNFLFSIIEAVMNIVLDAVLISTYGNVGAAWATLIVVVLSGMLSTGYLIYYLKT